MSTHAELRDEDLQAFIDGELDDSNKKRIEALVTSSQELQEQIAGYRADKARIRAFYSGGLTDPLPREWVERIEEATTRKSWQRQVWGITALAASVVLVLSGVIAFREYSGHRDDIVADALAARSEVQQPDRIVPIDSLRVADAEAGAMTRALAVKVRAPDLSRMGYRLAGIDAYSAPQRSFQLRYVGAGDAFSRFMSAARPNRASRCLRSRDYAFVSGRTV